MAKTQHHKKLSSGYAHNKKRLKANNALRRFYMYITILRAHIFYKQYKFRLVGGNSFWIINRNHFQNN